MIIPLSIINRFLLPLHVAEDDGVSQFKLNHIASFELYSCSNKTFYLRLHNEGPQKAPFFATGGKGQS